MKALTVSLDPEYIAVACLLAADGDLRQSMDEVLGRMESYEKYSRRSFAASKGKLRSALLMLAWECGNLTDLSADSLDKYMRATPLRDVLKMILDQADLRFDQDGEHWSARRSPGFGGKHYDSPFNGMQPARLNWLLRKLLSRRAASTRRQIMEFLGQNGFDGDFVDWLTQQAPLESEAGES